MLLGDIPQTRNQHGGGETVETVHVIFDGGGHSSDLEFVTRQISENVFASTHDRKRRRILFHGRECDVLEISRRGGVRWLARGDSPAAFHVDHDQLGQNRHLLRHRSGFILVGVLCQEDFKVRDSRVPSAFETVQQLFGGGIQTVGKRDIEKVCHGCLVFCVEGVKTCVVHATLRRHQNGGQYPRYV